MKILDNLSFTLGREDKVAFVGSNEQAITMLFKILTGEEEPDSGYYKWGVTTTQAYFQGQHRRIRLRPDYRRLADPVFRDQGRNVCPRIPRKNAFCR